MNLPIIDLVFFIIIFACAILAALKGFINELFNRMTPVVAVWMAILFYKQLAVPLLPYVKVLLLATIISFLIIFIVVFILVKLIQQIAGSLTHNKILEQLDKTLGFVFGAIEGLAIVALILILLKSQPWFDVSGLIDGSLFYSLFSRFIAMAKIPFVPANASASLWYLHV